MIHGMPKVLKVLPVLATIVLMQVSVACQQTSVAAAGSSIRNSLAAGSRPGISIEGEGDMVHVIVTLPRMRGDVALCVGTKENCSRDDVPLIDLIAVGDGTTVLRSAQLINLANGLDMHVITREIPHQVIRSVRFRNRNNGAAPGQANNNGWLSLGSGGQTGSYEETFSYNGSTAKYRVSIQDDVQTGRYGMLVYLHGDGAWDYEGFWNSSKEIAFRHDLIAIHVQAPTTGGAGRSWWIAGDANAEYLNALLHERVLRLYNIDRSKVVFSGQSGGPTFMTGNWMNRYMQQFAGGAVLMCGGMLSASPRLEAPEYWRDFFKIRIETTTGDFLNPGAHSALQRYQRYGMDVQLATHGAGSHCKFDRSTAAILDERVAELLPAR
jgi:hypothetical protein